MSPPDRPIFLFDSGRHHHHHHHSPLPPAKNLNCNVNLCSRSNSSISIMNHHQHQHSFPNVPTTTTTTMFVNSSSTILDCNNGMHTSLDDNNGVLYSKSSSHGMNRTSAVVVPCGGTDGTALVVSTWVATATSGDVGGKNVVLLGDNNSSNSSYSNRMRAPCTTPSSTPPTYSVQRQSSSSLHQFSNPMTKSALFLAPPSTTVSTTRVHSPLPQQQQARKRNLMMASLELSMQHDEANNSQAAGSTCTASSGISSTFDIDSMRPVVAPRSKRRRTGILDAFHSISLVSRSSSKKTDSKNKKSFQEKNTSGRSILKGSVFGSNTIAGDQGIDDGDSSQAVAEAENVENCADFYSSTGSSLGDDESTTSEDLGNGSIAAAINTTAIHHRFNNRKTNQHILSGTKDNGMVLCDALDDVSTDEEDEDDDLLLSDTEVIIKKEERKVMLELVFGPASDLIPQKDPIDVKLKQMIQQSLRASQAMLPQNTMDSNNNNNNINNDNNSSTWKIHGTTDAFLQRRTTQDDIDMRYMDNATTTTSRLSKSKTELLPSTPPLSSSSTSHSTKPTIPTTIPIVIPNGTTSRPGTLERTNSLPDLLFNYSSRDHQQVQQTTTCTPMTDDIDLD